MWGQRIGVLAVASALLAAPSSRGDEPPSIAVSGTGTMQAVPDVAEIQVGVVTEAATAKAALDANNKAANALYATLKKRGIDGKDTRTTRILIQPKYERPEPRPDAAPNESSPPKITGYRVENMVQVKARAVENVGALLDALVEAGSNQVYGISFRVDGQKQLLDEARCRALADARAKAEMLAREADVTLGDPIKIVAEDETLPRFQPLTFMRAAGPAPAPVAPGEQDLSVRVHVVYAIKRPK